MGNLLCCCFKMFCCDCSEAFEPSDNWSIESECRPGEKGAGYLYKRGKGAAVWSKRYFTLTETKLIYFTEQDRVTARGEIVMAGSSAKVSTTRANQRKHFYFTINHPECKFIHLFLHSTYY